MQFISDETILQVLDYETLIQQIQRLFGSSIQAPPRIHIPLPTPPGEAEGTLLVMPAWQADNYLGIKTITVYPSNPSKDLATIQGVYLLFDATTGSPLISLSAGLLTSFRTAATSALASSYLSRSDASTLAIIGTGQLAPFLVEAHATVRHIKKVLVWGRTAEHVSTFVKKLKGGAYEVVVLDQLDDRLLAADIISTATFSQHALIHHYHVSKGCHIDLVGAFTPAMRESDSQLIAKGSLFLDDRASLKESGDIVIPLYEGLIRPETIKGDLFDLCQENKKGRVDADEITIFKSVGHAAEDLAAAQLIYEKTKM